MSVASDTMKSLTSLEEIYNNLDSKEVMDRAVKLLNSKDFQTFKISIFKKLDMVVDNMYEYD